MTERDEHIEALRALRQTWNASGALDFRQEFGDAIDEHIEALRALRQTWNASGALDFRQEFGDAIDYAIAALEEVGGKADVQAADEQRLRDAAERSGVPYVGCDTPDALAETILALKQQLKEAGASALLKLQQPTAPHAEVRERQKQLWAACQRRTGGHGPCGTCQMCRAASALLKEEPQTWQPIASAPKDGTLVIVHAAERDGLPSFQTVCRWHPDAGWCVCELREVTHWMPLPAPPAPEEET